jgi:hypothetical protein
MSHHAWLGNKLLTINNNSEKMNLVVPIKNTTASWVPVAHACSYSEGRDQGNCGSKPAWANSSRDPISKKPIIKKCWWSDSRCRPEFNPQNHKTKQYTTVELP